MIAAVIRHHRQRAAKPDFFVYKRIVRTLGCGQQPCRLAAASYAELLVGLAQPFIDGMDRNIEPGGDRLGVMTGQEHAEHLPLALGQCRNPSRHQAPVPARVSQ